MLRRALSVLLTLALAVVLGGVLAAPASAAAPYCGITWGSGDKTAAGMGTGQVQAVRVGSHDCYDRVVIEVAGLAGGYRAGYVDQVRAEGSGNVVSTPGGAKVQLTVNHPWTGGPVLGARVVSVTGYPTLRSVVYAGSFEGYTEFGVGVRARLPMRVVTLAGPGSHSRFVIDFAHRW